MERSEAAAGVACMASSATLAKRAKLYSRGVGIAANGSDEPTSVRALVEKARIVTGTVSSIAERGGRT